MIAKPMYLYGVVPGETAGDFGPIGLDGVSQIVSQFNLPWLSGLLPYRESTPFLRVLTGGLFGFGTAWFAFPNIEESMRETRQFYIKKLAVSKA